MTKREKRLLKIRQNPKHVSKDELHQLFIDYGFVLRDGKGSHAIYWHLKEENPIVVAAHGKHVPVYIVKQVLEAIDRLSKEVESDEQEND
jgi:predicted RNA binding protein YcfA (HicA-like mRNA interferase family)